MLRLPALPQSRGLQFAIPAPHTERLLLLPMLQTPMRQHPWLQMQLTTRQSTTTKNLHNTSRPLLTKQSRKPCSLCVNKDKADYTTLFNKLAATEVAIIGPQVKIVSSAGTFNKLPLLELLHCPPVSASLKGGKQGSRAKVSWDMRHCSFTPKQWQGMLLMPPQLSNSSVGRGQFRFRRGSRRGSRRGGPDYADYKAR